MLRNGVERVAHSYRGPWRACLRRNRIGEYLRGEFADIRRHGSGKKESLPFCRHMAKQAPDIGEKAHVEHLVRLVQHQKFQVGKVDCSLAYVVEKSSRACNDDFRSPPDLFDLRIYLDAAVDRHAAKPGVSGQDLYGLMNLFRQFAGGRHNQCPHLASLACHQTMEDRQGEGGGLACTGLRQAHDVFACYDGRDSLALDGGGGCVASGRNSRHYAGMKSKCLKTHETP